MSIESLLRRGADIRMDDHALAAAHAARGARMVVVDASGRHHVTGVEAGYDPQRDIYLGWTGADDADPQDPGRHEWFCRRGASTGPGLREITLTPLQRDIVVTAAAILAWHDLSPSCESCGGVTAPVHGGFVRQCTACGTLLYPRHDPAIIIALLDPSDRLLLAHQARWPQGRVSVLAGFVEAGETLEQTCAREVGEEVGLVVEAVQYVTSQPWPFPRSLMMGFVGAASGIPRPDGVEIHRAQWFTREQVHAGLAAGTLSIPGPASVGRLLIDRWLAGELPRP